MKKEYKYHYVYRITNIVEQKYYYGSRSCNCNPTDDIGKKYFSRFTEKWFQQDQKENPKKYRYKVVKIFETCREDATELEVLLHKRFDVKNHKKFYNKANQTSKKFDTTGMELTFSDEHKYKISLSQSTNNSFKGKTHTKEVRYKIKESRLGTKQSIETRNKISNAMKGKKKTKSHCLKLSKSMLGKSISDDVKTKMSKTHKAIYNPSNHNWSKHIKIFDKYGNQQFESKGTFRKICIENNLPMGALEKSYKNDGAPIFNYNRKCDYTRVKKQGYE